MRKWIDDKAPIKTLNEMFDYCEKCGWMFYGKKCSDCGYKNTRIGKVETEKK